MADRLGELRDVIIRTAEREAERALSRQAVPSAVNGMGGAFPAVPGLARMTQFATGYDGTDTLIPFMLDLSLLDGPDLLAG